LTWGEFLVLFNKQFCPPTELGRIKGEFLKMEQGSAKYRDYVTKFNELSDMVPHLVRISKFIWGINPEIRTIIRSSNPKTYEDTVEAGAVIAAWMIYQEDDN
jgi:hypothetical protein